MRNDLHSLLSQRAREMPVIVGDIGSQERHETFTSASGSNHTTSKGQNMKQMVLTGLATEQSFGNQGAQFFLVFNNGDLRVPCTEQAAQLVVQAMYGSVEPSADYSENEDYSNSVLPRSFNDEIVHGDDGVEQA